jgi:uncharacterized protein
VDVDSHHYENESMPEILEYLDDPVLKQLALATAKPNAKNARILNTMVGYQDMGGRIPRYGLRRQLPAFEGGVVTKHKNDHGANDGAT